jgi:hypothetical protein
LTTHQITFSETPSPQTVPVLLTQRKIRPEVTGAAVVQHSIAVLTHSGIGTVRMCPPLPYRSHNHPPLIPLWMSDTANCATSDRQRPHPASTAIMARSLLPFRRSRAGDWLVVTAPSIQRVFRLPSVSTITRRTLENRYQFSSFRSWLHSFEAHRTRPRA